MRRAHNHVATRDWRMTIVDHFIDILTVPVLFKIDERKWWQKIHCSNWNCLWDFTVKQTLYLAIFTIFVCIRKKYHDQNQKTWGYITKNTLYLYLNWLSIGPFVGLSARPMQNAVKICTVALDDIYLYHTYYCYVFFHYFFFICNYIYNILYIYSKIIFYSKCAIKPFLLKSVKMYINEFLISNFLSIEISDRVSLYELKYFYTFSSQLLLCILNVIRELDSVRKMSTSIRLLQILMVTPNYMRLG